MLTASEQAYTVFDGRRYRVNASFDVVLDIQRLYEEPELTYLDKLNTALVMLGAGKGRRLPVRRRAELLKRIYTEHIEIPSRAAARRGGPPVVDFEADAEYIFASFWSDYGIDLTRQRGRLPWKKFVYLFQGLTEGSKIKEVMRIRSMEVPKPNKHNAKQIENILMLKSYYALPVRGGGGQKGLDALFDTLKRMAGA